MPGMSNEMVGQRELGSGLEAAGFGYWQLKKAPPMGEKRGIEIFFTTSATSRPGILSGRWDGKPLAPFLH